MASLAASEQQVNAIMQNKNRLLTSQETMKERDRIRDENKKDALLQQGASLDATKRERLIAIMPGLRAPDGTTADDKVAVAYQTLVKSDKSAVAALDAGDEDLPMLAMTGNGTAMKILIGKERQNNPAATPESVQSEFQKVKQLAKSKDFVDQKLAFEGIKAEDAKKNAKAERMRISNAKGTEAVRLEQEDLKVAWQMYRAKSTSKMLDNVASWNVPELSDSVQAASKLTNGTKIEDVLTAYMGPSTGTEAIQKIQKFYSFIEQGAGQSKGSIFGQPNVIAIKAAVYNKAREMGVMKDRNQLAAWISRQYAANKNKPFADTMINTGAPGLMLVGGMVKGTQAMTGYMSSLWGGTDLDTSAIDPSKMEK